MFSRLLGPATVVRVRDLPLLADVGINPDEVGRRQPLVLNIALTLAGSAAESLAATVDYRRIVEEAELLATEHIPLIETFAHQLGRRCMAWPGVVEARVSIDKPFALTRGLAGVEVCFGREAASYPPQGDVAHEYPSRPVAALPA